MGVVATLLAAKIHLGVAPAAARRRRCTLRPKALHGGPRLDHRAINAEVLVTGQALLLGLGEHLPEEPGHDLPLQQPVAVVGEDGRHPDRVIGVQPHKPAKQQVVVQLLSTSVGTNGVEHCSTTPERFPAREVGPCRVRTSKSAAVLRRHRHLRMGRSG